MAKTPAETNLPARQGTGKIGDVIASRPDFLKVNSEAGPRGMEHMEAKDIILPRLALCQTNTPHRKKTNEKYIDGLEEGMFFNTLTGDKYGTEVVVSPLFFYKSRIYFKDFEAGGGIICQAPDGKSCQLNNGGPCLHSAWGANGEPPDCNEFFNYPCLLHKPGGQPELIVVSLKSTGLKAGREWNSYMRLRGADAFAGRYRISSVAAKNGDLEYFTWKVENDAAEPWVSKDFMSFAESQYDAVHDGIMAGTTTFDVEGLATETAGAAQAEM
jgi:hypothetical protein